MIIATTGRRQGRTAITELIAGIEAGELHQLLAARGFRLQPFRAPRGLAHGNLRLRLTWKKESGAEVQTLRLTHHVTAPDRT